MNYLPVARTGDVALGICQCHPVPNTTSGIVIASSVKTVCNNFPIAVTGDIVITPCGHVGIITATSAICTVEGRSIARMADIFSGCFNGIIATGSSNVVSA